MPIILDYNFGTAGTLDPAKWKTQAGSLALNNANGFRVQGGGLRTEGDFYAYVRNNAPAVPDATEVTLTSRVVSGGNAPGDHHIVACLQANGTYYAVRYSPQFANRVTVRKFYAPGDVRNIDQNTNLVNTGAIPNAYTLTLTQTRAGNGIVTVVCDLLDAGGVSLLPISADRTLTDPAVSAIPAGGYGYVGAGSDAVIDRFTANGVSVNLTPSHHAADTNISWTANYSLLAGNVAKGDTGSELFRVCFTGSDCNLLFDTTNGIAGTIQYKVDGGAIKTVPLASVVPIVVPDPSGDRHTLTAWLDTAGLLSAGVWNFRGFLLGAGKTLVSVAAVVPKTLIVFGDSIVHYDGQNAALGVSGLMAETPWQGIADNTGYRLQSKGYRGANVAWATAAMFYNPDGTAYTPPADCAGVLLYLFTNDRTNAGMNRQTAAATFINMQLAAVPTVPIMIVIPTACGEASTITSASGGKTLAEELIAAVTSINNPRLRIVNTSRSGAGALSLFPAEPDYSDMYDITHPNRGGIAKIVNAVTPLVRTMLAPGVGSTGGIGGTKIFTPYLASVSDTSDEPGGVFDAVRVSLDCVVYVLPVGATDVAQAVPVFCTRGEWHGIRGKRILAKGGIEAATVVIGRAV